MSICENCGNKHEGTYGSGRFCSSKCSRGFSTKAKRNEINEKVRRSLTKYPIRERKCKRKECDNIFRLKSKNKKFCSIRCANLYQGPHSEERKRKISLNNKGGTCKWHIFERNNGIKTKVQGSYELRFAKILEKIDKDWIKPSIWNREHQFRWIDKEGKSHWYTPDFWSPKLGKYFETKGFWPKFMRDKKNFVESLNNVKIIYKKELEDIEKNKNILL